VNSDDSLGKAAYENVRASATSSSDSEHHSAYVNNVTVKLIERCVNELKLGKASGTDDLGDEHLRCANPSVLLILNKLFRSVLLHGFVYSFLTALQLP